MRQAVVTVGGMWEHAKTQASMHLWSVPQERSPQGATQPCRAAHLRLQALQVIILLGEVQLQGSQGSSQLPCGRPSHDALLQHMQLSW